VGRAGTKSLSNSNLLPPNSRHLTSKVRALTIEEEVVTINTPTGPMHTLVLKPTKPGKYPGILFYSEIFQVTNPIKRSAAIMACHGFVVAVPDIYHEYEAPGAALAYDGSGADRGNDLKTTKDMSAYDSDAVAAIQFLNRHPNSTGRVGVMGFCIGGHLAFRAALQKEVLAAAIWYPTDIHKGSPGFGTGAPAASIGAYMPGQLNLSGVSSFFGGPPIAQQPMSMGSTDDTLARVAEFAEQGTELMLLWGQQDPHIPREGRVRILNALMDHHVTFTWHEHNGQHAFMRDEGPRYDAELAFECYTKAINLFRRKLNEGDTPVPSNLIGTGTLESKH